MINLLSGIRGNLAGREPFLERYSDLLIAKLGLYSRELRENEQEAWQGLEQKLRKWEAKAAPFLSKGNNVTWITGMQSSALIGMNVEPALLPLGQLIARKIVPFAGEVNEASSPGGIGFRAIRGSLFESLASAKFAKDCAEGFGFDPTKEHDFIVMTARKPTPLGVGGSAAPFFVF